MYNGIFLRLRWFNDHQQKQQINNIINQLVESERDLLRWCHFIDSVKLNWWICWISYIVFLYKLSFFRSRSRCLKWIYLEILPPLDRGVESSCPVFHQFTALLSVEFWILLLIHWPCILIRVFFPLLIPFRVYLQKPLKVDFGEKKKSLRIIWRDRDRQNDYIFIINMYIFLAMTIDIYILLLSFFAVTSSSIVYSYLKMGGYVLDSVYTLRIISFEIRWAFCALIFCFFCFFAVTCLSHRSQIIVVVIKFFI